MNREFIHYVQWMPWAIGLNSRAQKCIKSITGCFSTPRHQQNLWWPIQGYAQRHFPSNSTAPFHLLLANIQLSSRTNEILKTALLENVLGYTCTAGDLGLHVMLNKSPHLSGPQVFHLSKNFCPHPHPEDSTSIQEKHHQARHAGICLLCNRMRI